MRGSASPAPPCTPPSSWAASGGFESGNTNILSASNGFWALGPLTAALSLFDGGMRRAQVRISRAQYDEMAADYRSTVLTAFREVEDDLARARYLTTQEGRSAGPRPAPPKRPSDLSLTLYRDGAEDYLEVVVAQTAALDAEQMLLQVQTQRLQIAVDTVLSIGGLY